MSIHSLEELLPTPAVANGLAPSLEAVVNFYNGRFSIGLTDQEQADLVAFLRSL